jgi:dehydrogenase/reductase SDR family member 1
MAADCAYELKEHNIAFVSIWPGTVDTEIVQEIASATTAPITPVKS